MPEYEFVGCTSHSIGVVTFDGEKEINDIVIPKTPGFQHANHVIMSLWNLCKPFLSSELLKESFKI